jgi:uncharacterized damage-inducible protein DinB
VTELGTLDLVRALWRYHWWANRRLFGVAVALGEEAGGRPLGRHFSLPTLKEMFAHIYAADWGWLKRWTGTSPARLPAGAEFPTMAVLRARWDAFEAEQRAFVEALTPADLSRVIDYKSTSGEAFASPMWQMLQHVPNHATHHRSEIATMITMISGSPPSTDLIHYYRTVLGRPTQT